MCLIAFTVEPAETTYHCRHFQSDIDYWQAQYSRVVKENKELEKELMEAKMEILEKGIKIPESLRDTKVIVEKKKRTTTNNYFYY